MDLRMAVRRQRNFVAAAKLSRSWAGGDAEDGEAVDPLDQDEFGAGCDVIEAVEGSFGGAGFRAEAEAW